MMPTYGPADGGLRRAEAGKIHLGTKLREQGESMPNNCLLQKSHTCINSSIFPTTLLSIYYSRYSQVIDEESKAQRD